MGIATNLIEIQSTIPENVKLVAVSKFHPAEAIMETYETGQRVYGESRMQELHVKQAELPKDIEWHFIGHLQTNKVKTILPYTTFIHSIDSWKLIKEIEKQASLIDKPVKCLLEIHIAQEDSKYGLSFDSCKKLLEENNWQSLKYAQLAGVMGMATYTEDEQQIRKEFNSLKKFFEELKNTYFSGSNLFSEISMGMSHDYQIAIEEGSTMVRIGSSIFGDRI